MSTILIKRTTLAAISPRQETSPMTRAGQKLPLIQPTASSIQRIAQVKL